ncbi:MAG: histidine kinase [Bacteroidota bacterium]
MRNIFMHALIWVLIYVIYTIMLSINGEAHLIMVINIKNIILYMLAYYTLRYVQLPFLYDRNRKIGFFASLIATSLLLYGLHRFGLILIDGFRGFNSQIQYDVMADILVKVVRFYSPAMVLLAVESHFKSREEQQRIRQLEKEKLTNELNYLKAQINPYFLLNTLNNLYKCIREESPNAPDMIMRLSGILDYVLYKSQQPEVALREEVEAIGNFIELKRMRLGQEISIYFDVIGDLTKLISPLVFLSLVEHFFKEEMEEQINRQRVDIAIFESEERLYCRIHNSFDEAYKRNLVHEATDLSVIKRQLELSYPNRYELDEKMDNKSKTIELILNLENG